MLQAAKRKTFKLRHGYSIPFAGPPVQSDERRFVPETVAALGGDYPAVRWSPAVAANQAVSPGDPLLVDRDDEKRRLVCWVQGTVNSLRLASGGLLEEIEMAVAPSTPSFVEDLEWSASKEPDTRAALLQTGLWWCIRRRPYDDTPDSDAVPRAIFVTAMDTRPGAPNPADVIAKHSVAFGDGVNALQQLSDAPVYVCQGEGPSVHPDAYRFLGPHPAGLVGTHIHHLHPVIGGDDVWHLNYQDTIAVGYLRSWGKLWCDRVVSVCGTGCAEPRFLTCVQGAPLDTLTQPKPNSRLISGSPLDGQRQSHLGRYSLQATALPEGKAAPVIRPPHFNSTSLGGVPGPIRSVGPLESLHPQEVEPLPLLRALATGDTDKVISHGGLGMVEEDVALLTYACPSKTNYGPLLRRVLDSHRGSRTREPAREAPPTTSLAPHVRSGIDGRKIGLAHAVAVGLALSVSVVTGSPRQIGCAAIALGTFLLWHALFAKLRGRPFTLLGAVSAVTLALVLPPTAPLWQVALGASVASVFAEEIFGGPGFGFIHPAVLGSTFLAIAFSGMGYDTLAIHPLAALPGGLFLVLFRFLSWRSLLAIILGFLGPFAVFSGALDTLWNAPWIGGLLLSAFFLGSHPDTTASTRWGRWVCGLAMGGLWAVEATRHGGVSLYPVLLSSLFAPLVDSAVTALRQRRRRNRHA